MERDDTARTTTRALSHEIDALRREVAQLKNEVAFIEIAIPVIVAICVLLCRLF